MGKNIKKYFLISGFNVQDANRGNQALAYGSLSFLAEKGYVNDNQTILITIPYGNPFKLKNHCNRNDVIQQGAYSFNIAYRSIWKLEFLLLKRNMKIPFLKLNRLLRNTEGVAAINGGDGFSDIYNTDLFLYRLHESFAAMAYNIPLIILPQTLGPFRQEENYKVAERILHYAKNVYVRDKCFVSELRKMSVKYELEKDLSYYMHPQKWNVEIMPNSIGLNISGLAYENNFGPLSGQFSLYPSLIKEIVSYFQNLGIMVYLISHSYDFDDSKNSNDDLYSTRRFYNSLDKKNGIILIDKDLSSPEVKYVISNMKFFIGTRMHANFAAIYSKIPLFGLAYSYKFQGAFEAHGIFNRTAMINNLKQEDIKPLVQKIIDAYHESL